MSNNKILYVHCAVPTICVSIKYASQEYVIGAHLAVPLRGEAGHQSLHLDAGERVGAEVAPAAPQRPPPPRTHPHAAARHAGLVAQLQRA
jgi:hypothetical protein